MDGLVGTTDRDSIDLPPYAWQGMRTILKLEGFRGLYKGLTPALLANGVSWGGYFLFYEHAKNRCVRLKLNGYDRRCVPIIVCSFNNAVGRRGGGRCPPHQINRRQDIEQPL